MLTFNSYHFKLKCLFFVGCLEFELLMRSLGLDSAPKQINLSRFLAIPRQTQHKKVVKIDYISAICVGPVVRNRADQCAR